MPTYKGIFNWQGEIKILFTKAKNIERAKKNLLHQLSPITKYNYTKMDYYFSPDSNNHSIEIVDKTKGK